MSYYYPRFTRSEGEAYYRFSDMMRKLEWEIHHKFWRGEGLPEAWHEIATDHGPGPKERITLWVDKRTVKFFRATGKGWQTRMNLVLVAYAEARASGAVKGAERFRLDRSAEKHDVDGPPPGWGQTRADEEEMAAFFAAREADQAARAGADPVPTPEPAPEPAPDPVPDGPAPAAGPEPQPDAPASGDDPAPDPDATPDVAPDPVPDPVPPADTAPGAPPPPSPPPAPDRPLTPQEALRAQYEADSAARAAERKARLAPRPGETNAERLERLLYEYEAGKARYVEMKRERGELKDVPEDWRTPRRR
jgi:uncharacterized protein (DUF4415 family)